MANAFLETDLDVEAERIKGILDVLRYAIVAASVSQTEEELDFRKAISDSIEARTVAQFILLHLPSNANPHNIDRFKALAETAAGFTRKFWRKFALRQIGETAKIQVQESASPITGDLSKPGNMPLLPTRPGAHNGGGGKPRPNFIPPNRKFTEDQVREIRAHFSQFGKNIPYGEVPTVASAYGVQAGDIRGILYGKTYRNVK